MNDSLVTRKVGDTKETDVVGILNLVAEVTTMLAFLWQYGLKGRGVRGTRIPTLHTWFYARCSGSVLSRNSGAVLP